FVYWQCQPCPQSHFDEKAGLYPMLLWRERRRCRVPGSNQYTGQPDALHWPPRKKPVRCHAIACWLVETFRVGYLLAFVLKDPGCPVRIVACFYCATPRRRAHPPSMTMSVPLVRWVRPMLRPWEFIWREPVWSPISHWYRRQRARARHGLWSRIPCQRWFPRYLKVESTNLARTIS